MTGVLLRRGGRDRHRGAKALRRVRHILELNTYSQGTPRMAGNYQKIEGTQESCSQSLQREHGPADTLISN